MTFDAQALDDMKRAAAAEALTLVRPGMRLGLGTGSTAKHFVDLLGEKVAGGLNVVCVPTSEATRRQAESLNIPLTTLETLDELDLTIDGADEIGPGLALIKGAGAAHLREKIVATASKQMVVIADATKTVALLGTAFPLPIEIIHFGRAATAHAIMAAFAAENLRPTLSPRLTKDGALLSTDEGNLILDARLPAGQSIQNPAALAARLAAIPGMIEHGLFVGLCSAAYIATEAGILRLDTSYRR